MRGPTFVVEDREFRSVGRFLSRGSSCSSEMISPPRVHRLSRRDRSVLRDWPELTRWRQKRREAFDHLLAVRQVALFIHPASWPLFEVWAISCKLISRRSLGYCGGVRCGLCFGFCAHAADHPPEPLPALSGLRLREGAALSRKQHHRDSCPASPRLEARMFRLPQARYRLRSTQHPPFRIRPVLGFYGAVTLPHAAGRLQSLRRAG